MTHEIQTDVAIIGAGSAGLYALREVRRAGRDFLLIDRGPLVGGIVDPAIGERAHERFGQEIELWLGAQTQRERTASGVAMRADGREAEVELLLAALGRRPNVDDLGLEAAGIPLDERGTLRFDPTTLQVGELPIFIAGDANADRLLMHEAADEGAIQRGETARDLLTLPFYHPVVEEMLQTALQDIVAQLPPISPYPLGLAPVEHL